MPSFFISFSSFLSSCFSSITSIFFSSFFLENIIPDLTGSGLNLLFSSFCLFASFSFFSFSFSSSFFSSLSSIFLENIIPDLTGSGLKLLFSSFCLFSSIFIFFSSFSFTDSLTSFSLSFSLLSSFIDIDSDSFISNDDEDSSLPSTTLWEITIVPPTIVLLSSSESFFLWEMTILPPIALLFPSIFFSSSDSDFFTLIDFFSSFLHSIYKIGLSFSVKSAKADSKSVSFILTVSCIFTSSYK